MSNTKRTLGPCETHYLAPVEKTVIVGPQRDDGQPREFIGAACGTNHAANAQLWAAANELLEGCQRLLNVVDAEPEACSIYKEHANIARAAIAKATKPV